MPCYCNVIAVKALGFTCAGSICRERSFEPLLYPWCLSFFVSASGLVVKFNVPIVEPLFDSGLAQHNLPSLLFRRLYFKNPGNYCSLMQSQMFVARTTLRAVTDQSVCSLQINVGTRPGGSCRTRITGLHMFEKETKFAG